MTFLDNVLDILAVEGFHWKKGPERRCDDEEVPYSTVVLGAIKTEGSPFAWALRGQYEDRELALCYVATVLQLSEGKRNITWRTLPECGESEPGKIQVFSRLTFQP